MANQWWRYHARSSRLKACWVPDPNKQPAFAVGDIVRLRGKPDKPRRVLRVDWHAHRYQYSYLVETSYSARGRSLREDLPYWFAPQLIHENQWQTARDNGLDDTACAKPAPVDALASTA